MIASVDRERQERDTVVDGNLEPVGQLVGAGSTNELGQPLDGMVGNG